MDFALTELQEMMQTMTRDFLGNEYTDKVLKEMVADEKGYTPELWKKLAEMNLMGLGIPEEYGGGGDFLDLTVVLEEMGRACFVGPFFSTVILGASTIMEAGSDEQKQTYLPAIAEGKSIVTLALTEASGRCTADAITVNATRQGGDYVINGAKLFVPDAHVADYVICVARTGDGRDPQEGITLFLVDSTTAGISTTLLKTISGDKQCEVTFDNVKVAAENVLGEVGKGWAYMEKVLAKAAVATCAEMVGSAEQSLSLALDYAKERQAFGHPIGAFQSIQHRCADMLIDIEGARFVTRQAAWRINEELPAEIETAIAKAWAGKACGRVSRSAHQVFGAIGFTEDHMLHYFTKHIKAREFFFGDVAHHLESVTV